MQKIDLLAINEHLKENLTPQEYVELLNIMVKTIAKIARMANIGGEDVG